MTGSRLDRSSHSHSVARHCLRWICLNLIFPLVLDFSGGVHRTFRSAVAASASSSLLARDAMSDAVPTDPLQPRPPLRRGYLISVGESINLTCPYKVPFYSWSLTDQPANTISDTQVLKIKQASVADSGRYTCQAVSGYGQNSVEMVVRVIDPSSYAAHRDCLLDANRAVNPEGPCFSSSASERELNPSHVWGDSVTFNCDVVTRSGSSGHLSYRWEVTYPRADGAVAAQLDGQPKSQRLFVRNLMEMGVPASSLANPPLADLNRYRASKLKLEKLDLRHSGDYRCIVIVPLGDSKAGSVRIDRPDNYPNAITRTFRLAVAPRAAGPIIQGPKITNETVVAGQDAAFKCEVNPAEHRSSTIRWGKSIQPSERPVYEAQNREVIQWTGGTFVVLRSVNEDGLMSPSSSSLSQKSVGTLQKLGRSTDNKYHLPPTGAVATVTSASQSSQLVIRKASSADAGRYICSVLTETGRDDHKFVQVTVVGGNGRQAEELTGSGVRQLTVYIAVPTTIFIICLCVVTYCLIIHRRSRNLRPGSGGGSRHGRNYFNQVQQQQTQVKSPSAASTCSIGICRNGFASGIPISGGWNSSGLSTTDGRLRPSPVGTGVGTNTVAYSSTNGSNSATGGAPYATDATGSLSVAPGAYPLLRSAPVHTTMGTAATPFYTVPNTNYHVNSGMVYPVANGHSAAVTSPHNPAVTVGTSATNGTGVNLLCPTGTMIDAGKAGAILNTSSSPESSSVVAGLNGDPSVIIDGRMLFQTLPGANNQSQQQPSPHLYTPYSSSPVVTDGEGLTSGIIAGNAAGFLCPHTHGQHHQHHQLTLPSTTDFDMGQGGGATPLLAFHNHQENNVHNAIMRA